MRPYKVNVNLDVQLLKQQLSDSHFKSEFTFNDTNNWDIKISRSEQKALIQNNTAALPFKFINGTV